MEYRGKLSHHNRCDFLKRFLLIILITHLAHDTRALSFDLSQDYSWLLPSSEVNGYNTHLLLRAGIATWKFWPEAERIWSRLPGGLLHPWSQWEELSDKEHLVGGFPPFVQEDRSSQVPKQAVSLGFPIYIVKLSGEKLSPSYITHRRSLTSS